jgi:hypothetical protein
MEGKNVMHTAVLFLPPSDEALVAVAVASTVTKYTSVLNATHSGILVPSSAVAVGSTVPTQS